MGDNWCSINLASCRQRAETMARQWHTNFWSPRSSLSSSDGGSRSVSPCLGFYSPAGLPLVVVDRPTRLYRPKMCSPDEDDEKLDGDEPLSPAVDMLTEHGGLYDMYNPNTPVWMPESPPESYGSESLGSDSPGFTMELEDISTASSGIETISDLTSPTDDTCHLQKGSALADELCSRLRDFQYGQSNGLSTTLSSHSSKTTTTDQREDDSPDTGPRLIRSNSLKTGTTPPDTPNRKKFVKFADALGLDLEAVRHFIENEDASIPQSAFADLKLANEDQPTTLPWVALPAQTTTSHLIPQFPQPAGDPMFLDRVRQQKLSLENLIVDGLGLTATVRVLNLGFEKRLFARYTTTEWAAFSDVAADYIPQSCDGFSDRFSFRIHLPHLSSGQRLIFALKYIVNGRQEYWDNNSGANYVLKVHTKQTSTPDDVVSPTGPRWLHHFM